MARAGTLPSIHWQRHSSLDNSGYVRARMYVCQNCWAKGDYPDPYSKHEVISEGATGRITMRSTVNPSSEDMFQVENKDVCTVCV